MQSWNSTPASAELWHETGEHDQRPSVRDRLRIGGVFFRAENPEQLADWNSRHLCVDPAPETYDTCSWWQQPGPTVFAAMPAHSEHFGGPGRSWAVNFPVIDLDAMVRQLRAAGIQVDVDADSYPNGGFASLTDPEGNALQLWQPDGADLRGPA